MVMLKQILEGMIVRKDHIQRNLYMTKGLIVSERVMLTLGQYIGRQTAHDVIYEASMKAFEEDTLLGDILKQDERVTSRIPAEVLEEVLEPMNYTGSCGKMVDQVVAKWGNI